MRRVVVTGIGLVTPLGCGVDASWRRLIEGESGILELSGIDTGDTGVAIGAQVPGPEDSEAGFRVDDWVTVKEKRRYCRFVHLVAAAADEALTDAAWKPTSRDALEGTGVLVGSGIGGLGRITQETEKAYSSSLRRMSPFMITGALINMASGFVSIRYGFQGPNLSVVTACASGTHAIGDAARFIAFGDAEVMVAGGSEAAMNSYGIGAFASARALSKKFNDEPQAASRPWDRQRDGFVMGEGAGVLILEELEHALNRGASIYGEVVGYGVSGDAHHVTAPAENGRGALLAMKRALQRSELAPEAIDYINAHGTSTQVGDLAEVRAIKKVWGRLSPPPVSSTKSSIGHLLGAAGSVEAIFSLLSMRDQILPPTLNLDNPSEECDLDFVPHCARAGQIRHVMSNSFGFGGTNASLIFSAFSP
ncbi:MAG: beta-ketoacyl-ACP synthase II [Myxococcota bacterium]|nr:beta-ketoacyl-ACP synthase II [Myxococcota bacterium]